MADRPIHYIKRNDLSPPIECVLMSAGGIRYDLSNCTVRFHMAPVGGGTPTINAEAEILSAHASRVRYQWQPGETDVAGDYDAEWEVVGLEAFPVTFPNDDNIRVRITPDVA